MTFLGKKSLTFNEISSSKREERARKKRERDEIERVCGVDSGRTAY
jgi:hypothetical protein